MCRNRPRGRAATAALLLLGVAILRPLGAGAAADAGDPSARDHRVKSEQRVIRYSLDELGTANGMQNVYDRILQAARNFCRYDGTRGAARRVEESHCRTDIVGQAFTRIGSSALSALHSRLPGGG